MRKWSNRKTVEENQQEQAYDRLAEQYAQELEAFKKGEGQTEMNAFFARHEAGHLNVIMRAFQKRSWLDAVLPTVPRLAKIAALVIVGFALFGGTALAVNGTLRVHVMRLELEGAKDYTALSLVEDEEASFDMPAEWTGKNYLGYIPEGMKLAQIWQDGHGSGYVDYTSNQGSFKKIVYNEEGPNTVTNLDTENAVISSMNIQGYEGHMAVKNNTFHFYWSDGKGYFILSVTGFDEETALKIVSNIRRLN